MANPTVSAGLPRAFLDFVVGRGGNRQTLLELSRISPEELRDPDNRISVADYLALIKAGIEQCQEPALSLLFGEAVGMPDVSIVGLVGGQAENVESARRVVNRYARLMLDEDDGNTSDRIEFIREGSDIWFKFNSVLYTQHPLLIEAGFARCICGGREMLQSGGISLNSPFPKEIHFTHEEPSYRAEYERVFRAPLFFRSRINGFLVADEFLSLKLPRTNPYLSHVLTTHADELLQDLERSRSTRGRVEGLLIPLLHTGEVSIEMIAGKMGLSRQTLFRKLKAEGVNFEKLLNELRYRLALQYLNEKKLPVNETSYLLGFSDPAAFSRAFKRWTGCNPSTVASAKTNSVTHDLVKRSSEDLR